jgi:ABC-type multidrug transport system fused ATPase/permease subunit
MKSVFLVMASVTVLSSLLISPEFSTFLKQQAVEPTTTQSKKIDEQASKKIDDVKKRINENEDAQRAAESILDPIYKLAEKFSFGGFYWIAFALMAAGVVSFALQLVIGKLFLLAKLQFSLTEIVGDALGLLISLVGLVLTTQAATENSFFTQSAFAVLSSAALGIVCGVLMFVWSTKTEARAADSRKTKSRRNRE